MKFSNTRDLIENDYNALSKYHKKIAYESF